MKNTAFLFFVICAFITSCKPSSPIEGKWVYDGGIYNSKPKSAAPDFRMERVYTGDSYEAFLTEPGTAPVKYSAGVYTLKNDTFVVTSTFSDPPSSMVGKPVSYVFKLAADSFIINGTLPNGMQVEEHWKRVKD